jgi:hypothetical protein
LRYTKLRIAAKCGRSALGFFLDRRKAWTGVNKEGSSHGVKELRRSLRSEAEVGVMSAAFVKRQWMREKRI